MPSAVLVSFFFSLFLHCSVLICLCPFVQIPFFHFDGVALSAHAAFLQSECKARGLDADGTEDFRLLVARLNTFEDAYRECAESDGLETRVREVQFSKQGTGKIFLSPVYFLV